MSSPIDYDDDDFEEFDEGWSGPSDVDGLDPFDKEYDVP